MTGEDNISRRMLLGSLGTVGCAGAVFGTGTTALFTDREMFEDSVVRAGLLDMLVSWKENGVIQTSEDGTATVTFDLVDGKDTTVLTVEHSDSRSNPAHVWFRPTCPTGPADAVDVTLYVCGEAVSSGSLLQVANSLRDGFLLDQYCGGCLGPDEDIEVRLESQFSETDDYNATNPKDVALEFQYRAIQCRNNDTPSNPFEPIEPCVKYHGISYIEIYAENGCESIGKLELDPSGKYDQEGIDDSYIEPETYDLYEDDSGADTGYDVVVTDTVTKDGGNETIAVEFELVDPDGSDPDLCRVDIKGGSGNSGGISVSSVGGEITYNSSFDGNSTDGLLYAPEKEGGS